MIKPTAHKILMVAYMYIHSFCIMICAQNNMTVCITTAVQRTYVQSCTFIKLEDNTQQKYLPCIFSRLFPLNCVRHLCLIPLINIKQSQITPFTRRPHKHRNRLIEAMVCEKQNTQKFKVNINQTSKSMYI